MRAICLFALALAMALPAMAQRDPEPDTQPDPAAQFQAIVDRFSALRRAHSAKLRAAKTKAQKRAMFFTRPRPDQAAAQMLALARKYPADAVAFKALAWVARQRLHGAGLTHKQAALEALAADHIESPGLYAVCQSLGWGRDKASETLLRAALEKSPHATVRALACITLASRAKRAGRTDPARLREATTLFERVVKEYADQTSLVARARQNLHEIRNLIPGKRAPEVTGVDLQGKPLKLSDFQGKVIVFYFWGHW